MCKYGIKTENVRFGMRAAIAKQVRGDAALRTVPLFRISVEFGAGRVLVRGAQRRACIKDKHTSRSHTRIFTVYQPHIWRKRLFRSENLAFYCYSEVSFRDAV